MKYVIDRIENEIAILESLETQLKKELPVSELPEGIKEGNVLIYEKDSYTIDIQEEKERRESLKRKFDMLKK